MALPTFVEHDILQQDAERGIFYQNFEDFWERRMEPMQFIPREAKGVLAVLRQTLKDRAQEQYQLFMTSLPIKILTGAGADCGSSPQAGGACPQGTLEAGESPLMPEALSLLLPRGAQA